MFVIIGTCHNHKTKETRRWAAATNPLHDDLKSAIQCIEEGVEISRSMGAAIHYWNSYTQRDDLYGDKTYTYTIYPLEKRMCMSRT